MAVNSVASSIFKGLKEAKPRVDGNYLRVGKYWLRLEKIKVDTSRKKEAYMAVEMVVVKVLDNVAGQGHRVGETVTHMMMAKHDSFLGNVKAMIAAMTGLKPEEIDEAAAIEVSDDSQPLKGIVVDVYAHMITTKANTPFTAVNYMREVPPQEVLTNLTQEEINVYFPDQYLQKKIAYMQQVAASAPAAA